MKRIKDRKVVEHVIIQEGVMTKKSYLMVILRNH